MGVMGTARLGVRTPGVDGYKGLGVRHASGNTEQAAEYRSLGLRQGQGQIISGLLPCTELTWQVPERRDWLS